MCLKVFMMRLKASDGFVSLEVSPFLALDDEGNY